MIIRQTDMKKNDFIIIFSILAVAVACMFILYMNKGSKTCVKIYVDNELVATLPIDENREFDIEGVNGSHNLLVIENGKIYMKEADCPDKICIQTGFVTDLTQTIVCVPNHVVVTIE